VRTSTSILSIVSGTLLAACGGTQTKGTEGGGGGGGEPASSDSSMASAWGGGAPDGGSAGVEGPATEPAGPPPVVVFVLENKGKGDLIFPIDKGWQSQLFAISGKKPKAKTHMLYPIHCTESCEAPPDTMCPECKEEEDIKKRKQQEKDETKREVAPEGGAVEVGWDGQIYVYEKSPKGVGPLKKCECWRKAAPEPGAYTIKACGLRPSTEVGKPTKPVCATGEITLPTTQGARVTIGLP
jgi:hypothetical protein